LDGDGADELVVSFGADPKLRQASLSGTVRACQMDAAGVVVPGSCTDLGDAIDDPEGAAVCVDAAVGRITGYQVGIDAIAPDRALLMLCHRLLANDSDVFRVDHVDGAYHATRLMRINSESVERIFLGDLTGDAVDDLVAIDVAPGT